MKLLILLLIFLVTIGTIGYGEQETMRGMWYLGCFYGIATSMTLLLILEKIFPNE